MAQVDRETLMDFYLVYIVSVTLKNYSMTGSPIEEDTSHESTDVRKYSPAKVSTEELNNVLTNLIDWIMYSSENFTNRADMLRSTEVINDAGNGMYYITHTHT